MAGQSLPTQHPKSIRLRQCYRALLTKESRRTFQLHPAFYFALQQSLDSQIYLSVHHIYHPSGYALINHMLNVYYGIQILGIQQGRTSDKAICQYSKQSPEKGNDILD